MKKYFNEQTAQQLTLVAKVKAKVNYKEQLKAELLKLVQLTREEEGCISYHLYADIENPGVFLFHEIWASQELWQKHMESDHLKAFITKMPEWVDGDLTVEKWERSEAPTPAIDKNGLVLFAYNQALAGKEKEWTQILTDLIAPTVAEEGALHYELHINREDSNRFMFHETWATVENWHKHMEAKHLIQLLEIIGDYTENGITVIKTQVID